MTFEIFLDILIIALLCVGIVYAVILEHRLSTAAENKREMARLIEQFYQASQQTAEEFMKLKKMVDDAHHALKKDMEQTTFLRDELTFLFNKIQEKEKTRSQNTPLESPQKMPPHPVVRSQAEQDLINALNTLK